MAVQTKRWRWLRDATGEDSARGMARRCGVSHPTVLRWLKDGIPSGKLLDVVIRLGADPIAAFVAWGYLSDEQVADLNWAAIVRYVPTEQLTAEAHRRSEEFVRRPEGDWLRKTSAM